MLLIAPVIRVCALLWSYPTGDRTESQGGYWLKYPEALSDFSSQEGEEGKWVRLISPNVFGIRNWFYGRQIFQGPDGYEWWEVAVNIEALLSAPPLTSCCVAWFLIGHRWVPVHVLGVGDPWVRSFPFPVNKSGWDSRLCHLQALWPWTVAYFLGISFPSLKKKKKKRRENSCYRGLLQKWMRWIEMLAKRTAEPAG